MVVNIKKKHLLLGIKGQEPIISVRLPPVPLLSYTFQRLSGRLLAEMDADDGS